MSGTGAPSVLITVDVEPDCPPFLEGWRGVEEGMPRLLDRLAEKDVRATFFVTGRTAARFPATVRRLVDEGHELACHGHTHRRFGAMSREEATEEIAAASRVLRAAAPVTAFRAPNLEMPEAFLPLLADAGYRVDSSQGAHRIGHRWRGLARGAGAAGVLRLPASTTSSALRLPPPLRDPWLARLRAPVVLFVHPWEMVDLRNAPIRWDCRAGTGPRALAALAEVIDLFRRRGDRFGTVRAWADA